MFEGFTEETQVFLWGITLHNERGWFLEHRDQYERALKIPFAALAQDTMARMRERYPSSELQLHVSRIYRDARRLFGRGPYKDHLWFSIKKDQRLLKGPMFWFEIGAASYAYGMGFYDASAQQMELFRRSVRENPGPLERLARRLERQDRFVLEGEAYARPKGEMGPLLDPWYNRRRLGLQYEDNFGGDLFSPDLPGILVNGYDFLMPYYEYLCTFDVPELRDRYSR
jgi:uncharacterized protein (TIGR02453 family)